ncbi:MAG: hypoxanthine phosphoribosyltransferase, partial [Actinomycetota bacterium]|nr:hypoxanthine phosphoribosyltransferase [Actinomycetota bacterium]
MDPADVDGDITEVLYTPEQIQQRLVEIGAQIDADYAGRDLLLVGVLKGAVMV